MIYNTVNDWFHAYNISTPYLRQNVFLSTIV